MHRLSGGYFSTSQYLLEVQSSEKLHFILGGVVGVAALGLAFARRDRTRGVLLVGLATLVLAVHVPTFGPMADLGSGTCWPMVLAAFAAAFTLSESRALIAVSVVATLVTALLDMRRSSLPNELHFSALDRASFVRSVAEGLGTVGPARWMAIFYLPALLLPVAVGIVTAIRKQWVPALTWAALASVAGIGLGWIFASASPNAREAWDLAVRARVAWVWAAGVLLAAVGARDLSPQT